MEREEADLMFMAHVWFRLPCLTNQIADTLRQSQWQDTRNKKVTSDACGNQPQAVEVTVNADTP